MSKTIKKVCKCENCGNEAEMVITCSLPPEDETDTSDSQEAADQTPKQKVKGTATCSHCGNEADMWVDF